MRYFISNNFIGKLEGSFVNDSDIKIGNPYKLVEFKTSKGILKVQRHEIQINNN